jgi:hypothetical protein
VVVPYKFVDAKGKRSGLFAALSEMKKNFMIVFFISDAA